VLNQFYEQFVQTLADANENMRPNHPTATDISCPECQRFMTIRTARTGVFLSCSGYALPPKERCTGTLNLVPGQEVEAFSDDEDEGDVREIQKLKRCRKCETAMDSYLIDEQRRLHVCGKNPECDGYEVETGKFRIKGYEGPIVECEKCGSDMQLKTGRFGKYFGCTGADCKNTRKLLRNGEAAPPRAEPIHMLELKCTTGNGHFVLRDGAAGMFLASSEFPRSRETKKPTLDDLQRHRDKLDPKYHYLLDAPRHDPEGNPAIVRFSRKSKDHYIGSEVEGKATNWALFYEQGRWVESAASKA
jgi:DNA topoisomerase-1